MDRPAPPLPPVTRDPEFAPATEVRAAPPAGVAPESYLRIVVNPFLALAGLVGWVLVVRECARQSDLIGPLVPFLVLLGLASLRLVAALLHFHCLDCGTTGRLSRWRSHRCPRSDQRRVLGRPWGLACPPPFAQLLIWMWAIATLALLARRHWPGP